MLILYFNINFPQWLVKKSLETRHERGAQIRSLSVSKFHRMFSDPESETKDLRSKQITDAMVNPTLK